MINGLPVSIIYTQDPALLQRLRGFLHERSTLLPATDPPRLQRLLQQHPAVLLFADLCCTNCAALLKTLRKDLPDTVMVALGDPRSDPALTMAGCDLYGIESADADRLRIQTLFAQAQRHIRLQTENRLLREDRARPPAVATAPLRESRSPSLLHFSGALRRFDNIDLMLENIVECVASCTCVSRVAIFAATTSGPYRFRTGLKCLEQTRMLSFDPADPFVRWLELHAYCISRSMLRHIDDMETRAMLDETLDHHGGEAILPLFGRERLIGWLGLGHPSSGVPFEQGDIEELSFLAEQVSITIENAMLHENLAIQKALDEHLLQSIPVGIIATDPSGHTRWFNHAAEQLLKAEAMDLINLPIARLPVDIAARLHRCLTGETDIRPVAWTEPRTRRDLSLHVQRLQKDGICMGSMAILKDLTEENLFREKQNNLERAKFWNELASAISHEVRNPLVAISTFAQMLPERYADEEFRTQFRDLTIQEVGRLNSMIDQLDLFANPPTLHFAPVAADTLLNTAICRARMESGSNVDIHVETTPALPLLRADAMVLTNSLVHLLDNAMAAVEGVSKPCVSMTATPGTIGTDRAAVVIEVRDNGHGIPGELLENVYSPFCTTTTRGVGLGLAIVRRTMIDHEGLVRIESGAPGTTVRLTVPASLDRGEGETA